MKTKRESGFALLLVLTLLALLVLVLLAMSTLSRLSSQTAGTAIFQTQARQNALVGLGVALGELQRLAGPDNTVTAQSSIKLTTSPIQRLTGVWLNQSLNVDPSTWLISGNQPPASPLTIIQTTVISATDTAFVALVDNAVTAANDRIRARKIPLPGTGSPQGNYAFWIGDEGCKASVNVPTSRAITTPGGLPIRLNPVGSLSNFSIGNPSNALVLAYDQIGSVASGSNLKANFHSLTATSYSNVSSASALRAGTLNINARNERAWLAWLQAYNDLAAVSKRLESTLIAEVAADIASRISARVVSTKKVSRGPFIDPLAFRTSGILADALAENGVVNVTGSEILDMMEPSLVARSDTFRIRAYGDATNPVDPAKTESTAFCEAIVQRTADAAPNGMPGKKFVITYFRWLGPDDI